MRKLVLDVSDLAVEAFETSAAAKAVGTVAAREDASHTDCPTNCLSDPCFCHVSPNFDCGWPARADVKAAE